MESPPAARRTARTRDVPGPQARAIADGLYMLTAGGDYEASLLLLDSIWKGGDMEVRGEFVVAIPARDLLLVTGSRDRTGIEKLRRMVRDASTRGPYRLTGKLFTFRDGKLVEFRETEADGAPEDRNSPRR